MTYKLASHDSMTYLKPKKWWQRLGNFLAKCQSKTIVEQLEYGVSMFDLRIRSCGDSLIFAHGLAEYGADVFEVLNALDFGSRARSISDTNYDKISVRLLLEEAYDDDSDTNEVAFIKFCKLCEEQYPNLEFCGAYRKWDWKQIYKFNSNLTEDDIDQNHSSFVSSKGKRTWCFIPWLYAKLNNKKILKKGTDKKYLMIDFI